VVKQIISKCVTCLKCEGLPYHVTTTPDLPAERESDGLMSVSASQVLFMSRISLQISPRYMYAYSLVAQQEQYTLS